MAMYVKAQPCLEMPFGEGAVVHLAIAEWVITTTQWLPKEKRCPLLCKDLLLGLKLLFSYASQEENDCERRHSCVCLSFFSGKQGSPNFSSVAFFQVISQQSSLFIEITPFFLSFFLFIFSFSPTISLQKHSQKPQPWFPKLLQPWSWLAALSPLFITAPDQEPGQPGAFFWLQTWAHGGYGLSSDRVLQASPFLSLCLHWYRICLLSS